MIVTMGNASILICISIIQQLEITVRLDHSGTKATKSIKNTQLINSVKVLNYYLYMFRPLD